jgi:plasmid maintenance system antidote protein VapI
MSVSEYKIADPAEMAVTPGPAPAPGAWVRTVMDDRGLSVAEAARRMKVDRAGLTLTLRGTYALTADLAFKLEALLGVDAWALILAQARHEYERDSGPRLAHYRAEIEPFPKAEMEGDAPITRINFKGKLLKPAQKVNKGLEPKAAAE